MNSLDNGGRFYNLLTDAKDDVISTAELARAAGVFSGKQAMVIYLELSLAELPEKGQIISKLTPQLKAIYEWFTPQWYLPTQALKQGEPSQSAIVTGIPEHVDSKTEFTGFILIPIIAGSVTTFTFVPIMDQYDVYHLRSRESDEDFLIAHNRGRGKLPHSMVRCGGVLKELKKGKKKSDQATLFLETMYYTPL